ncbi:MAG: M4 family metallopeptidase, partial [Myxococcota bacterium]
MPHLPVSCLIVATLLAGCVAPTPREKAPRFRVDAPDSAQIEAVARDHLRAVAATDDIDDLSPFRTTVDPRGTAHVRLDQLHGGVPVLGGQVIVHVPADGHPIAITDHLRHTLNVDVVPNLTEAEATAIAKERWALPDAAVSDVELVIVREAVDHLTWRVALEATGEAPAFPVVFVDARDGEVVLDFDNLQTARDRQTFDAGSTESWPSTPARTENQAPVGSVAVDTAHDYTGVSWDYYDLLQGRDSYDDAGATVVSVVEIGPDYYNAYWNGTILGYGDGGPGAGFAESLDIVAHELTHAVTSHTARLVYNQQSGGLNEATSDIMAAVIESWNDGWTVTNAETWMVGEGRGGSGFRSMWNPPATGDLDSFLDYNDSLDVHVTSGIANRAFVDWVDDPALTIEQSGDIWYTALANYMTPRTTFAQARTATQQAAFDLFGPGSQVAAVAGGWELVDVPGTPAYEIFDQVGPISMNTGQSQVYTFTAASDATAVRFVLVGDDGDAELFVNEGSTVPDSTTHDCGSTSFGSREVCSFDPGTPGDYTVLVEANWGFNDARLYAWQAVPGGVVCTDVDGDGVTTCQGDCDDL